MTLREFYYKMDEESKVCANRLEQYIALAKLSNVSEEEYINDSVYKKLVEDKERYKFIKNKLMESMR